MIKISFWVCGICLVAWIIFVGVMYAIEFISPSETVILLEERAVLFVSACSFQFYGS